MRDPAPRTLGPRRTGRHGFPSDVLADRRGLDAAYAALAALSRTLPWSGEPDENGIAATGHGPHDIARPPTTGYTEQEAIKVARLKADVMRLAMIVTGARLLEQTPGLVEARMGLISAAKVSAELPDFIETA
ncbi:hypothetical protein ACFRAO_43830 [Streptomyces sp. NPDC056656]|uniref:hypothetical protein n=1 Tax=Streptomyces sp. NPDC056656 TaxID=3345895 RepID=UPI003679F404